MNITFTAPPQLTGSAEYDTALLNDWCRGFYMQIKRILYSLDTSNICELNATKINGTLSLDNSSVEGSNIKISGNEFSLTTPDGSEYIKLEDGKLKFKGTVE